MKLTVIVPVLACLVLTQACGRRPGKMGSPGLNGANGVNGFSLVVDVVNQETEDGVLCKRTDIFQDLNRDSIYSEGDAYQNGFLVCDGAVGAKGDKGDTGETGSQGEQGEQGEQGVAGSDGANGSDGSNGIDGANGIDGKDGKDGLDADTTYSVVEIIDPCGDAENVYDEVILKLGNGTYLASFSDNASGLNTRFGILPPGTYQTTDGTNCIFTL